MFDKEQKLVKISEEGYGQRGTQQPPWLQNPKPQELLQQEKAGNFMRHRARPWWNERFPYELRRLLAAEMEREAVTVRFYSGKSISLGDKYKATIYRQARSVHYLNAVYWRKEGFHTINANMRHCLLPVAPSSSRELLQYVKDAIACRENLNRINMIKKRIKT